MAMPRPIWSAWLVLPGRLFTSKTAFQRRLKLVLLACTCFLLFSYWFAAPSYYSSTPPPGGYVIGQGNQQRPSWWDWLSPTNWNLPFLPTSQHQRIQKTLDKYRLAPDDPFPHQLPPARNILPEVATTDLSYPLSHQRFPQERLRSLYPAGPPGLDDLETQENIVNPRTPIHPFIRNWTSPEWFHADGRNRKPLPKVQFDFKRYPVAAKRRKVNDERKEAVKRAFVYAWQKYKDNAWGESVLSVWSVMRCLSVRLRFRAQVMTR